MNQERVMQVLLAPIVTEKTQIMAEKRKHIAFKVAVDAAKDEIKTAVETLFKVEVKNVRVVNVKGKVKQFGGRKGKRKDWRKAYVALKEGHDISFSVAE